jgi:hypothetical protein
MRGAVPPLPQYAFTLWRLLKAQGQIYLFTKLVSRAGNSLNFEQQKF